MNIVIKLTVLFHDFQFVVDPPRDVVFTPAKLGHTDRLVILSGLKPYTYYGLYLYTLSKSSRSSSVYVDFRTRQYTPSRIKNSVRLLAHFQFSSFFVPCILKAICFPGGSIIQVIANASEVETESLGKDRFSFLCH